MDSSSLAVDKKVKDPFDILAHTADTYLALSDQALVGAGKTADRQVLFLGKGSHRGS